jgi:hypothetical protein
LRTLDKGTELHRRSLRTPGWERPFPCVLSAA